MYIEIMCSTHKYSVCYTEIQCAVHINTVSGKRDTVYRKPKCNSHSHRPKNPKTLTKTPKVQNLKYKKKTFLNILGKDAAV